MQRVYVTLPEECKYLVHVQEGQKYVMSVTRLMHSVVVLLDTAMLEELMRRAYQDAMSKPAPRTFALRLQCMVAATMQFEVLAEEQYVPGAKMLTRAPRAADVQIDRFFKRLRTD